MKKELVCPKCKVPLKPGKAIQSTIVGGSPDFAADGEVVTYSEGGPGKLIDCLKCPKCGYSVTKGNRTE